MARVYRAVDERLEREVALKVMHSHLADNDVFRSRFQREARSAARLSHPAVVAVFDQGVDGDAVYLAMELIEGKTVREFLNAERVLTVDEAVTIIEPVLDALGAAHRAGIIHRDVKPENVLMGEDGTVKVADFGLARAVTDATATSTNTVMGTVAYLSPELLSRGVADARSDVYAVGVLLHEMLSGTQPHVGETPIQVAYQHVHEDLPSVRTKAPWPPPQIDALIEEMAARDPDDRPRDGDAALARLLEVYREIPVEERAYHPTDDEVQTALVAGTPATGPELTPTEPPASVDTDAINGETMALSITKTSRFPSAAPPPPAPGVGTAPGSATAAGAGTTAKPSTGTKPTCRKKRTNDRRAKTKNRTQTEIRSSPASPKPKKRRLLWLWIILPLLLLLGGGTWWYFFHGPGSYTIVPNVVGAPATSAAKVLAEHDLDSKESEAFDDEIPIGYVIKTDPKPDSNVKKETAITMTVSKGPEYFEIPEIIDLPVDEALAELEAMGLKAEVDEDQPWDEKIADRERTHSNHS